MTAQPLCVARRFHGPPDSGNGGYVAGLVAQALGGPGCTVTLLRPPPLERPLELRRTAEGAAMFDGEQLIASAVPAELELEIPAPPRLEAARVAEEAYVGHHRHHYPSCFVCGPKREPGDGLAIYPGDVGGQVAATWTPGADLASANGNVRREFLWAALDCPGYWASEQAAGIALLGRMTASVHKDVPVSEALIVTGWPIAGEGRKHHVGTALHRPDGELVACARSTWITVA